MFRTKPNNTNLILKITLSAMLSALCHLKLAEVSYEKNRDLRYGLTQVQSARGASQGCSETTRD